MYSRIRNWNASWDAIKHFHLFCGTYWERFWILWREFTILPKVPFVLPDFSPCPEVPGDNFLNIWYSPTNHLYIELNIFQPADFVNQASIGSGWWSLPPMRMESSHRSACHRWSLVWRKRVRPSSGGGADQFAHLVHLHPGFLKPSSNHLTSTRPPPTPPPSSQLLVSASLLSILRLQSA